MSSIFSGFFGGSGGQDRVGSVSASFYGNASPDYERLDGRSLVRASYADLSALFPIGKHTGTVRTLSANAAVGGPVIATANHFVLCGPGGGANAMVYSTDGATYSTATTPSATPVCLCAMAARIVTLSGAAAQGIASATLDPTSTWAVVSGGPVSVTMGNHFSRMSYSPTLARMLVVAGGQRYTMEDASTAYTSRASTSGMGAPVGTAWTGNRWANIAASSQICEYTTDGITYTAGLLAEATSAAQGNIVSDLAGTVVVSGSPSGLQVSHDHGQTWAIRQIPGIAPSDAWRVQRAADRFVVPTLSGLAFSLNGDDWFLDLTPIQSMTIAGGVARKGTVTVQIPGSNTTAYSFTESSTEFQLPSIRSAIPVASGTPLAGPTLYIKAR
jgi:hypothetical protein